MSADQKQQKTKVEGGMTKIEFIFSIFCMIALAIILPFDRALHAFDPPISEYWYTTLLVGAGGKQIKDIFKGIVIRK